MIRYIARRLLAFIPTLLMVAVIVALMVDLIPGDPVSLLLGQDALGEAINQKRMELGLDRPMHVRLFEWVTRAMKGDFGESYFLSATVTDTIVDRFSVTLWLASLSTALAAVVGILVGVIASVKQGKFLDWLVQVSALTWLSVPQFWMALTFIYLFSVQLGWFPIGGYVSPFKDIRRFWGCMALPVVCLGLSYAGIIARFTRTGMLEVLRKDYINTARAKGLHEIVVLFRHALKNALISIITVIGIGFGDMLGGAVVTEMVFSMPGVGRMILDAVKRRDYPVIQGGIFVMTAAYLLVNLAVDLLYTWADKRVTYE